MSTVIKNEDDFIYWVVDQQQKNGITKTMLADEIGLTRQCINKWIGHVAHPGLKAVVRVVHFYGYEIVLRKRVRPPK